MRGPAPGSRQTPTKVCTTCGDTFFTQVGVDEHVRRGDHSRLTFRRTTPKQPESGARRPRTTGPSPTRLGAQLVPERAAPKRHRLSGEAMQTLREVGHRLVAIRRRCDECGRVLGCGGFGLHQKASGHAGWTEAT